jgi:hypothetical protein
MFEKLDLLDKLGLFSQADKLEKTVMAVNNFMLTKKKVTPEQQINTKLDVITSKLTDMRDIIDEGAFDAGSDEESKGKNNDI